MITSGFETICDGGAITPFTPTLVSVCVAGRWKRLAQTRSLALRIWACAASEFATSVSVFEPARARSSARAARPIARSWKVASASWCAAWSGPGGRRRSASS